MGKSIGICSLLVLVSACAHLVEIRVESSEDPVFHFQYRRAPADPVTIYSLMVREYDSGELAWHIGTANFQTFTEEDHPGTRRWDPETLHQARMSSRVLESVRFGQVPEGFVQYFPEENARPRLQSGVMYLITVDGADGPGSMNFTLP